jgi:hypothetical protein
MTTVSSLVDWAADKTKFTRLAHYSEFARAYLDFAEIGLQAEIVCQNETQYQFWQYKADGHFNITRPLNSDLMLRADESQRLNAELLETFEDPQACADDPDARSLMRRGIYTLQQCIGSALDALPAGSANTARKVNGDLFERLMRLLLSQGGIDCQAGVVSVPISVDGVEQCRMSYQHDLIFRSDGVVKGIGSVKTSSKDRLDKIFIDKFLFNSLTKTATPHLAVFLNDVQRGRRTGQTYRVASTFLPGHFKGYTIALNPLDGVYFCDIRPSMNADPFLAERIRTVDHLFCRDVWGMLARAEGVVAEVDELVDLNPAE